MLSLYSLLLILNLISPRESVGALQRAVNDAMGSRAGAAVVLDVQTGRILASYRMDVASRRVVSPGSTVKPFTLLALMEAGVAPDRTVTFCPRTVRVAGRILDCSHDVIQKPLDAVMALAHSCNHFFVHHSEGLSLSSLYRAFARMGFSAPTGKWPTELPGNVAQPASREALQLMSIGEGSVAVTPLALAEAYRTIALRLRTPEELRPEFRVIAEGLESAVRVGTGRSAASLKIQVAGKTGTSAGHAWFAGYAPAKRPEIAVVVFLERGTGGRDAAPLAGRIFEAHAAGN